MSTVWAAVIAALGASALTGLASLGVMWLQQHLQGKSADRDALQAAVTEMLSASLAVSMRARTMGDAMKIRSGLGEGVDVTFGWRKPLDPLEFHDWMARDMGALGAGWSKVWAIADDQELIRRANALLDASGNIISVATARMPAATLSERARRLVKGERWTPQMEQEYEDALTALARAREQLAQQARTLLEVTSVQLFGHGLPEGHGETPELPAADSESMAEKEP
jgi:hypothetical protein